MKSTKDKTSNLFFALGAGGAIYLILAELMRVDGKKYLNSREGYFIFAAFTLCILIGGIISGTIGAKGIPIKKEESPVAYWIIIVMNVFIVTYFLIGGIKK